MVTEAAGCFSDPPSGEKRWAIFLSYRAKLTVVFGSTSQAHEEMVQGLQCSFSFLWTHGLNLSAMSFGTGTPSTVLWSFAFLPLDPPPPPSFVLQGRDPCTLFPNFFCQLALGELWPVGGTRKDWRKVG